jgi:hypothetical protein
VVASSWFFYLTLTIFILSSVWVATASLYPMAFDEEFHYGLIQIYAGSLAPYGIETSSDMAQYGAATKDVSYLFHYLMSFPYRILEAFGASSQLTIVLLRLLNIGMMIGAFILFRRAFRLAFPTHPGMVNLSLAVFSLVPIVPVLAGQLNYDNLLIIIVAYITLLAVKFWKHMDETGVLPVKITWAILLSLLFVMPVKYASLPIVGGLLLWLAVVVFRKSNKRPTFELRRFIVSTWKAPVRSRVILTALLVAGLFFAARYPLNFIQHGNFIVSCDEVFSEQACQAYGPWERTRMLRQERPENFIPIPFVSYLMTYWIPDMAERMTFAVAGKTNDFQTKDALPLLKRTFMVFFFIGLGALMYQIILRRGKLPVLAWFSVFLAVPYIITLAIRLYGGYVSSAQPVAINGRYLLIFLPVLSIVFIWATYESLKSVRLQRASPLLALFVLAVLIVTGGGVSTYILLSEPHWFWSGWGQMSHDALQSVVSSLILRIN